MLQCVFTAPYITQMKIKHLAPLVGSLLEDFNSHAHEQQLKNETLNIQTSRREPSCSQNVLISYMLEENITLPTL